MFAANAVYVFDSFRFSGNDVPDEILLEYVPYKTRCPNVILGGGTGNLNVY